MSEVLGMSAVPDMKIEEVFVIPDYPHAWWEREEVKVGCLVQLSDCLGRPGDYRIYRVTGIWDGGASLKLEAERDLDGGART